MTNFPKTFEKNFEKQADVSGSSSDGKELHNVPRPAISAITVNNCSIADISKNQDSHTKNQQMDFASLISITMTPVASSSPRNSSDFSGIVSFNPHQRNKLVPPRQYFATRLSSDRSSDGGYFTPNNSEHSGNNNEQQRGYQRTFNSCSKQWSLDSSRLSSGSNSSTGSIVFSRSNHNYYQPTSPEIKHERKSVLCNSSGRRNLSNLATNIRSGRFYGKIPPGTSKPTATTHFASSKCFNATLPSSLPQPPQQWLLNKTDHYLSFNVGEGKDERELAKSVNTFDYYNLKMLLTVGA
ncbi:uncharacterized protein LOC128922878 [Zeugodacus cucurbitae]|uniref:uncharacterized protein LOC128922878 n=1 Tax=Zeugodacus cucurbitae TaxID=28588 RepID=UPI0023D8F7CD|nr:uncharacterized protein LOC128922878 [Zeugodacus cucurbitae]